MKKLIYLTLLFALVLGLQLQGFSQTLEEDYDRREAAVDPFEDEDKLLRETKINTIIARIKRGDRTVLRLVVFDTFEAVHDEIVRQATGSGKDGQKLGAYYNIIGQRASLPAYYGGFDNQDPKVRLKCIGYLGDWVDEVGQDLPAIEKEVDRRLATNIETRKEVRYGYRVLKMKIVRRRVIDRIKKGDEKVLVTITPEEFLPLVYYEPRIRTIYLGAPGSVKIRSIVLDPGVVPETGALITERPGRAEGLDLERVCYTSITKVGDHGEVAQWLIDNNGQPRGGAASIEQVVREQGGVAAGDVDSRCVKAVFGGINNKSLFVREHSARIFLNYIKGFTGDPNYQYKYTAGANTIERIYQAPKQAGGAVETLKDGTLAKMASDPYYVRIAQVAWDNVKWAEFNYNDRVTSGSNLLSFIAQKHYLEYEYGHNAAQNPMKAAGDANPYKGNAVDYVPAQTRRYFTEAVTSIFPEWGTEVSGNYRNDIKEVARVLGLSWYLDAEYTRVAAPQVVRSRVDTLFNDIDRVDRPRDPDRSDRLEGETDSITSEQR